MADKWKKNVKLVGIRWLSFAVFVSCWEWFVHSQGTESLNVLIRIDDENDIVRYVLRK